MNAVISISERLVAVSRERHVPLGEAVAWSPQIPDEAWCFSPELISLNGTSAYRAMSEFEKRRLSLLEAANFFSLNVHGEKHLIAGIARRLHSGVHEAVSPYLHHLLDEENKHMACFAEFCHRYGCKIYPERKVSLPRDHAPGEEDFLFFAQAMIFEEVVNACNLRMARDARLARTLREINRMHHLDEARHLAFGRGLVLHLFRRYAPLWSEETRRSVGRYLAAYIESLRGDYFNPDVYRDAGLSRPLELREAALSDPGRRALWRELIAGCSRFLAVNGILTGEPQP